MEVTELRIGNLVLFASEGKIMEVTEVTKTGLVVKDEQEEIWLEIDQFEGIQITEDILLDYGFKFYDNYGWYVKNYTTSLTSVKEVMVMYYNLDTGRFSIVCKNKEQWRMLEPAYAAYPFFHLHKLQNICFELMGGELTKKEKDGKDILRDQG